MKKQVSPVLLWGPLLVAVIALVLVGIAYFLGYMPGDTGGARRREWAVQTGGISIGLALLALIPLRFAGWVLAVRWMLFAGAAAFLVLALVFWLTVGR